MNRVTIKTKKKSKGTMLSVFLEYNPAFVNPKGEEIRYEFLNLEKYVKPVSEIQKQHNEMIDEIAEAIRCDRYMRMVSFRHTFAMSLLNKGTDIYTIAKLMGHKSVSSTQVYAKLSDEQLRRAVLRL